MSKELAQIRDSVDLALASPGAVTKYAGADPTYIEIISRIFRIYAHLDRHASEIFENHGITRGEADVLGSLYRVGDSLAPTVLAEALLCSPGAMTNRLNQLERAGLVRRVEVPTDKRSHSISLTPEGKRVIVAALQDRKAAHADLIPGLSYKERKQLIPLLRKLLFAMESNNKG
jgi:DNA-binding MarR family transcriptional regulator